MLANRGRDTAPELALRRALRAHGLRGYRVHYRTPAGRPDVTFTRSRVAVFVHGCFWHACPTCALRAPVSNSAFWRAKFERNRSRDAAKREQLEALGWRVVEIWTHELDEPADAIRRIDVAIASARAGNAPA